MNNNWLYAHCAPSILVCVFSTFNKIHSKLWILHCRYMKQLLTAFSKGSHSTSTMEFRRYLLTVCDVTTMVLGNFSFPHRRHDLYTYCIYNYYMQGLSVYRWQNRVTSDHLSGKAGNVGDFTKSQAKKSPEKSCRKLFIVSCIFLCPYRYLVRVWAWHE